MKMARQVRRGLALTAALVLAVALLTTIGVVSPASLPVATAGASPSCQSDGALGCTAKLPCATANCPTVDISPITDMSDGQYVFIKATNFPSGDTMRVAICSTSPTVSPDPTDPYCLNGNWETNYWDPTQIPISQDAANANLSQVSIPVFFDAAGSGDDPLPSHDVLNANGAGKGFFCDNTNSPCAVEVTEELGTNIGNGPPDSTSNTLVFPINFRTQSTGCPKADPVLNTDSSFSLEHFMPPAVDASCKGAHGVVALNTATDNLSDISDLTHGGVQIAFVDDPGDPKIQSALAGKPYAYIPVAVSATVVSFLAGQEFSSFGSVSYPLSSYNLTPNMLAGLITSEYQTANGSPKQVGSQEVPGWSDNLIPPLKCAQLFQCPSNQGLQVYNEALFNTFDLLNTPPPHVVEPQQFGAFMSNVSTGSSYQATSWICKAPNAPFPVTVDEQTKPNGGYHNVRVSVTDQNIGSTTLTSAPVGTSIWPPYTSKSQPDGPKWVFPTCQGYSTIPSLASGDTDYGESQNPSFQAKSIRTFAYGGQVTPAAGTVPAAGFGVMDSSEAQFNGLNMANLQNADGQFVYPSAENIEAAAAAMTPCPAHQADCPPGTYQINYATAASPTSYPMPDITYAVVSTAPQKAAQVTETEDLLTSLVTYSNKASLPGGYAPLPADLYQAALTDITHDFLPKPGSSTKPAETGASAGGSPGASSAAPPAGTSPVSDQTLPLSTSGAHKSVATAKPKSKTDPSSGLGATTPTAITLLALNEVSRYLLPIMLVLAAACLIGGPLLYFLPEYRRRRKAAGAAK